jgi:hypothetical protein
MSDNNTTNALLLGGAAIGAAIGGLLYRNHQQHIEEDKLVEEEIVEKTLPQEKIIVTPLPTSQMESLKVSEGKTVGVQKESIKSSILQSELTPAAVITEKNVVATQVKELEPVVQEVAHPILMEEIQPVVHRDIKKTEVHQVTQPIYEEYTAPTVEINRELEAEIRPVLVEDRTMYKGEFERGLEKDSYSRDAVKKERIVNDAIVEENITKEIVEIVQPVIHRDTVEPTWIKVNAPVYEKIVEQPTLIHEIRQPIIMSHGEVEAKLRLVHKDVVNAAPAVLEKTTTTTVVEEKVLGKAPISETPIAGK